MRRRDLLRYSGVAVAGAYGSPLLAGERVLLAAGARGAVRNPNVVISLVARPGRSAILPGNRTSVWSYRGKLKDGAADTLTPIRGSYLGPVIRVRRGDRVRIVYSNRIPEESIVHWHGLHVPDDMDGHPRLAIGRGGRYVYEFDVANRAGMYWYHPHPHGRTGAQVYAGLAGVLIVTDDEEEALGLPSGAKDIPLVIQDRRFGPDNEFDYAHFNAGPMQGGHSPGMLGNRILVNGVADAVLDVTAEPHRLRLLNGSNSRIYKLAWKDSSRLQVIGNDGGLLRRPIERPYVTLAPGERVDLWVDFREWPVGSEPVLESREFDAGMMGFSDPHWGNPLHMGTRFDVLTARIGPGDAGGSLPAKLSRIRKLRTRDAVNPMYPKRFEFAGWHGRWTINGRTFEMTGTAPEERMQLGTMELIELSNPSGFGGMGGMMGMTMPHPVHLHGEQFQIVDRSIDPRYESAWRSVKDGYVDDGWKDTVLLMPGESVRILKRFDDFSGLFLYHCHNLEHEDMGMMRNFEVY